MNDDSFLNVKIENHGEKEKRIRAQAMTSDTLPFPQPGRIRLYNGKFKVFIIESLDGHALVEALEDFSNIKKGQQFTTRKTNLWNIVKEPEP